MTSATNLCAERVPDGGRWPSFHGCMRPGKIERSGKWWCTIHDPERVAAKQKENEERYEAERMAREDVKSRAQVLADALGFGRPIYVPGMRASGMGGYAKGVFLTFEEAEKLLAERK